MILATANALNWPDSFAIVAGCMTFCFFLWMMFRG